VVGAGTVLDEAQLRQAMEAGARFGVSPGCTAALAKAVKASGLPFLPGVQTVSEALALREQGFRLLKFFPADAAGGTAWLKAVAAPLAGLRFCPTGGIGIETAPAYLALPNVACVGGSWVAPRDAVAAGDWSRIERLAGTAAALKRS
jgi:2-dehydro-3-deoxyphosphogluconate aldolase/(4S)-4-hydroxy-2-oxoglutarate aldolase